jgi:hypothetical protein
MSGAEHLATVRHEQELIYLNRLHQLRHVQAEPQSSLGKVTAAHSDERAVEHRVVFTVRHQLCRQPVTFGPELCLDFAERLDELGAEAIFFRLTPGFAHGETERKRGCER